MAQIKPEWNESEEFATFAAKLAEKYPERFSEVNVDEIIAYTCMNKDRPEGKSKPYEMSGSTPPESFTNSKTYFVKMFNNVWEQTRTQKLALVFSALSRIDTSNPGKVKPLDYSDQEEMVSNFGANWHDRGDLPDLLSGSVDLR